MIIDKETNRVYFSDLIRTNIEYKEVFKRIQSILDKYSVDYNFLFDTKDIWCRDYMPIQKDVNKFVQFRYEPQYLKDDFNLQSNPNIVLQSNGIEAEFSNINLDGGNVIRWSDKVIMTTRIFRENPTYERNELIESIERILEAEVLLIPDITGDLTGHADGHVRFINEKTVLVNQFENEYKYWTKGFLKMIKQTGLDFIEIPWFEHKDHPSTAIGDYVNYLEIGNLILFPIFDVKGNMDDKAVEIITNTFPDRIIETLNINEIAKNGGLLNCITWTIKT